MANVYIYQQASSINFNFSCSNWRPSTAICSPMIINGDKNRDAKFENAKSIGPYLKIYFKKLYFFKPEQKS